MGRQSAIFTRLSEVCNVARFVFSFGPQAYRQDRTSQAKIARATARHRALIATVPPKGDVFYSHR